MLTDTHCHIHLLSDYPSCVDMVIQTAKDYGVTRLLNVAVKLSDLPDLHRLAAHENLWISIGMHPNESPGEAVTQDTLLEQARSHDKIIAIGETGLDYYRHEQGADMTWQQDRFLTHIAVARETKKPLIIHTRDARKDTIECMKRGHANDVGGIMHCFTEDWEMAKQALDLGFYISFSGIVTFKNATQIQEVAAKAPLDRILVETDCPYLAPVPLRGKPNQPAYTKYTAQFLADLRGMDLQSMASLTTDNFCRLFSLVNRGESKA